jgi:signal transduction histidine kinase
VRWEVATAAVAVAAATVTAWVTLDAGFLAHPALLAVQKADLILGPVLVGLYWMRRRPASRFGPLLVAAGFVAVPYALQSSTAPWLFGAGLVWENLVGLAAFVLILAFPSGRLDGWARAILTFATVAAVVPAIVILLLSPQIGAGGSISGCRDLCPENAVAITSKPALALDLWSYFRWAVIATAVATAALLIRRFVTGTPPRRRAIAIGTSVALLFLALQVTFHVLALLAPDATAPQRDVAWSFAVARSAIWYGFLAALIAAQLSAGRALQRLVRQSLERPSQRVLAALLREALGDPGLRLAFWDARTETWSGAGAAEAQEPPDEHAGRAVTIVELHRRPAVAIVHDAQLRDDPELLESAGAAALLAAENAELDDAWSDAVDELRQSRARIVRAGSAERRKLERDLHDSVQQRLIAIRIDLGLAGEIPGTERRVRERLEGIGQSAEEALDELREVAQGLYPPLLTDWGLAAVLDRVHPGADATLTITARDIGRYALEIESAVYYCCMEAIQNATKHGGRGVRIAVSLYEDDDALRFEVTDDGRGFDPGVTGAGTGLQNIGDRLGALGGRLTIVSAPGSGTTIAGAVPLRGGAAV